MAQFQRHFVQDLTQTLIVRQCGDLGFSGDNLSNVISVDLYTDGEAYSGGGTCAGACICPDGSTVALTGSVSGKTAFVTLTEDCFAIPGQIGIAIRVTTGTTKTTVLKAIYNVEQFATDNPVDPGSRIALDVGDLINRIDSAVESIPASADQLKAAMATNFSTTAIYSAGDYVWYNGVLYRFTSLHTAGAWTGTDVKTAVTGNDINNLANSLSFDQNLINDWKYTVQKSDIESGYWAFCRKTANTKRLRFSYLIPVKSGMIVDYYSPTLKTYIGILNSPDNYSSYLYTSGWMSAGVRGSVQLGYDGYMALMFESTGNVTPNDFDGEVTIRTQLSENHFDKQETRKVVADRVNPVIETLGGVVADLTGAVPKDGTIYNLFESVEDETIDDENSVPITDESGSPLEFPRLKLKELSILEDYYDKQETDSLLLETKKFTTDRVNPISKTLGGVVANLTALPPRDETIYQLFESVDDTIDDEKGNPLLEENGSLLLGERLRLKDSTAFIPENYVYNSGTGGYYQYTALPILYLDGDVADMTKSKKATLTARFNDIRCGCSCKWQGASSVAYPKKNYTVTFDIPIRLKDEWGSKRKYVLKSEFLDSTHARNTVSAKLWADIVRDREMVNGLTTLDDESGNPITDEAGNPIEIINSYILGSPGCGATDGFHVMVVMNNKYIGLYTMGIPKDDWMFGMDNGMANCAVLNAEKNCPQTQFWKTTTEADIDDENTFSVEYASDDMSLTRITNSVNTMLNAVISSVGNDYRQTVGPYFDLDNAMDYLIYSILIGNWDGVSHNYNLYTYDGTRWAFSAYDLDNTFGVGDLKGWSFTSLYDNPAELTPNLSITALNQRLLYIIKQYDTEAFKARYNYLRNNVLSENNIYTSFYNFVALISKRVLAEEFNVWPTSPRSGAQYIDAILNFYRLRCASIDAAVAAL